jgi:hypothetical protein
MHCDVFKYIIIRDAGTTGAAGASAPLAFCISNQGIGTGGGARAPPPPIFFKGLKVPFFVMKSALFVQANVTVNTKLTLKVPFLFGNFQVF